MAARALALATKLAPVGAIALALGAGAIAGPPLAVLILAGSALIGAIATMWASVRALVGETELAPEEAFALGAPSSEEEQKRAVLRAIKDIEFERSVGKISDEDYDVLLVRYRADAKRLLRQIDETRAPDRARAEELAAAYLAKKERAATATVRDELGEANSGVAKAASGAKRKKQHAAPLAAPEPALAEAAVKNCIRCSAKNDQDAAFCKGCGDKLTAEEASA